MVSSPRIAAVVVSANISRRRIACMQRRRRRYRHRSSADREETGFDRISHRGYSAAPATGVVWHCNNAIISSVERTSANIIIMIASVALCSSSARQALASDTKNTLWPCQDNRTARGGGK